MAQQDDSADNIEEVVVTARGRVENLQDVPIAISAFDQQAIERRGIAELEDVARFTAGFAFEDFDGGNASPVIRGQATLRTVAREQTVATFLDGVYMPRSWLVDLGTNDIERIEIVKGPQSARYGRNAFSGAINYVPLKSDLEELSATASLTAGSDELFDYNVGLTMPIVPDVFAFRIAYNDSQFDGTWENNHPNARVNLSPGTEGNVGGWERTSASAGFLFNPTDKLELDFAYYRFETEEEARAAQWRSTGFGDGNCGPIQPNGPENFSLFCGEYPVTSDTVTVDPRGFGRQSEADILRFSAAYDITDTMQLSYLYGTVDGESFAANTSEADTVNCGAILGTTCNFQASPIGEVDYSLHELKLSFNNDGPIIGSLGLFFMDGQDLASAVSINVPPGGTDALNPTGPATNALPFPARLANFRFREEDTDTDVVAIFGDFTYNFSNGLTRLSGEARYTEERITTFNRINGDGFDDTFDFFTPKVTLEHDLNDRQMVYGTIGRGAKAGGFNPGAVSQDLTVFDPEFNTTFELGAKNRLFEDRATVNAAFFYTSWSDLQINSTDPLGTAFTAALTRNLGDATIWGVEAEGSYAASDNLTFDFAISYTKGEYDDGTIDDLYTAGAFGFPAPCDGTVCPVNGDIGGNDIERAPDLQLALGAQWEAQINSDLDYYVRGDLGYQSAFFSDSINSAESPDRTVLNASAGLNYGQFNVNFWVRNLADEEYVSNSLAIIQSFSNNILGAYYGERRTFGLTLTARY